jgi:TetR/AcrR family transcriptional regulator, cholesterol catabolism regulator
MTNRARSARSATRKVRRIKVREVDGISASRLRLVSSARRLFAEFGFESTSIRQIANDLGIVSASLYHHFATKEEILHEILRVPILSFDKRTIMASRQAADPEHILVSLAVLRVQTWLEDWEAHAIATHDTQFFKQHDDFDYVERSKLLGYKTLEAVLQDGIDAGMFRADLDIYFTILAISSILNSAARAVRDQEPHTVEPPARYPMTRITELHVDFVLRLVRSVDRLKMPLPRAALKVLDVADA